MTQSTLQIANDIVEACPYTAKMKSAHKLLLAAMISEELSRQRKEGFDMAVAAAHINPPSKILQGEGVISHEIRD